MRSLASRRADTGVIVLMRADRVTIAPELVERMQAATLRPEPIADPDSTSDRSTRGDEAPSRSIRSHAPWHPIARLRHRRR